MPDNTDIVSTSETQAKKVDSTKQQRTIIVALIVAGLLFIALVVLAVIFLLQPGTPTDRIRDIFIIFMALETLVIGAVLVILIIQIASLINLLQNEVKPILDATNETVSTLRGTTSFLSENLVEPVVKLNTYLAGLQRMFELIGLKRTKM